ncbi:D-alanyl carrier protein [Nostocales cyanobacterium HT-58-2]|nr:D-alanyl carrier protein [Nostocales cyanobacterium HT-58-2]
MKEAKIKIKNFLTQHFSNYNLQDDENIFFLGFVNSMFAMQLVLFIEKEFQIAIDNEDLELDNFKSINAICSLLERKTAIYAQD